MRRISGWKAFMTHCKSIVWWISGWRDAYMLRKPIIHRETRRISGWKATMTHWKPIVHMWQNSWCWCWGFDLYTLFCYMKVISWRDTSLLRKPFLRLFVGGEMQEISGWRAYTTHWKFINWQISCWRDTSTYAIHRESIVWGTRLICGWRDTSLLRKPLMHLFVGQETRQIISWRAYIMYCKTIVWQISG